MEPGTGHNQSRTIFAASRDCSKAMDDLFTVTRVQSNLETLAWDGRGRFRLWASNIGALQSSNSSKSLDYRLRDASLMRQSVVSGLDRLLSITSRSRFVSPLLGSRLTLNNLSQLWIFSGEMPAAKRQRRQMCPAAKEFQQLKIFPRQMNSTSYCCLSLRQSTISSACQC